MTFSTDLQRFTVKVDTRARSVFVSLANKVHGSIVEGSGVTGSPGQPVQTGNLRNSWTLAFERDYAEVRTNVEYAPSIEAGFGPHGALTLQSKVGGFHSVKLTVAGASHLQAWALRELGL